MRPRATLVALLALAAAVLVALRRRARSAPPLPAPAVPPAPAALPPGPRFLSVPWELTEPPDERAELTIGFDRSERMTLDRIDARETPTQVFVTVLVRWEPAASGPSAADARETVTVALREPLGDRELVPAATDALYP